MTRYDEFHYPTPRRSLEAMRVCGTSAFLRSAEGIVDAFHRGMKSSDGSSGRQFAHAYAAAVRELAPRLLAPYATMDPRDPTYADHLRFFRLQLDGLRAWGLSDGEIVTAVAHELCRILAERGAAP